MIEIETLSLCAGAFAVKDLAFRVSTGEYAVLMGKTGCGKTTLLETLCGLRRPSAGKILFNGRNVTDLPPRERQIGYVPQDGALFSTMTVREHLAFALRVRKWPPEKIRARVAALAEMLGLGALLERRSQGLSGGETQRVALGRALAATPQILCLDEPLNALDDETREAMYRLLESVRAQTRVTVLHVTHSAADARRLADMVLLLKDGKIISLAKAELHKAGAAHDLEKLCGAGTSP